MPMHLETVVSALPKHLTLQCIFNNSIIKEDVSYEMFAISHDKTILALLVMI